ncbi:transporter of the major facilitator superfamily (MFS) [Legionella sainthelensi]|uniref:Transporter of the major facilitator superfamily (MFS) n=1 Tax=Legionella sainthelensi TaxID=28087 RepID=A0A0W0YU74_9GAMM|nr:MFS transporter [Legionella sainthelensi]KTD60372.1 transporter of the major facilitator superfamily (MFS) [Legionella sainthelensi]VEH34796.1 transporter of the major facilitator superfamily (MFS) [Legionella sainthelensi]
MDTQINQEKKQLWIILLIVLISFLSSSIAYPIFPPLFLQSTSHSIIGTEWSETGRRILLGFTLAIFPLGQFIGAPILGKNSDLYGRKKILIFSLAGSLVGYLLTVLSFWINCFWLLLFSRFLTGFMEGTFAVARAYASELTTINKFVSFGRLNSMAAIGYIIGPVIGGLLSDSKIIPWFSWSFPFTIAALASVATLALACWKLPEHKGQSLSTKESVWDQLNIVRQFWILFQNNPHLKHLLLISTFFTFAVDIFYEFGPVYLAGKWLMSPAMIAIYNAALSATLALGASWLPRHLSKHIPVPKIITLSMMATALIFICMIAFQYRVPMFLFFALIGFSITSVTTTMTIHISNKAHATIQGEVMGAQLSLRTLADAVICLFGGLLIVVSLILPIILCCITALIASALCMLYLKSNVH